VRSSCGMIGDRGGAGAELQRPMSRRSTHYRRQRWKRAVLDLGEEMNGARDVGRFALSTRPGRFQLFHKARVHKEAILHVVRFVLWLRPILCKPSLAFLNFVRAGDDANDSHNPRLARTPSHRASIEPRTRKPAQMQSQRKPRFARANGADESKNLKHIFTSFTDYY
jgi:hypothetical protein